MFRELSVAEQRYQAILAVIEDGLSITEVADKVGVSRQTLHAWLSRYAAEGLPGLTDRSHRPRSCPHQMDPAVEVRITELRALVRLGLVDHTRRKGKRAYRRWQRSRPMKLWQMDVMGAVMLADGTELKAVTAIDDCSRFALAAGLVRRATSRPVCGVFGQILTESVRRRRC